MNGHRANIFVVINILYLSTHVESLENLIKKFLGHFQFFSKFKTLKNSLISFHFIYLRRVALRQKPFFKGPFDKNVNYKNAK